MSFLHMEGRCFIRRGQGLFDTIVKPLLVILDRNQVIRSIIYNGLRYFMSAYHGVNRDEATFDVQLIGNGFDFIRLGVGLSLPDNHPISSGKSADHVYCRLLVMTIIRAA